MRYLKSTGIHLISLEKMASVVVKDGLKSLILTCLVLNMDLSVRSSDGKHFG